MLEKPLDILKLDFANSILLYIFIVIVILCIPLQSITLNNSKLYAFGFFFFIILITGFQLASNVYSNSNNIELHNKHYDIPDDKISSCDICKSYRIFQSIICGILVFIIGVLCLLQFYKNYNSVILNICVLFVIISFIFGCNIGFYFTNTTSTTETREDHKNSPTG
jgi:hypothetical protein